MQRLERSCFRRFLLQEKTETLQDLATPEMQFSRFFTALTYHGPPEATLSHFIRLDCMDVGSTLRGWRVRIVMTYWYLLMVLPKHSRTHEMSYLSWNQHRPWKSMVGSDEFPFGVLNDVKRPIFRYEMLPCFQGFGASLKNEAWMVGDCWFDDSIPVVMWNFSQVQILHPWGWKMCASGR